MYSFIYYSIWKVKIRSCSSSPVRLRLIQYPFYDTSLTMAQQLATKLCLSWFCPILIITIRYNMNQHSLKHYKALSNKAYSTTKSRDSSLQEKLYILQQKSIVIYYAEFYQEYLLICSNKLMVLYDLVRKKKIKSLKIKVHTTTFIPQSQYLAYVDSHQGESNRVNIWDYREGRDISKITVNFQINKIKAAQHCIAMSGAQSISIVHFPTLKPIFNDIAGNGFNLIFDISKEGLTLVHSTYTQGEVIIRNFTNIKASKYIDEVKSQSSQPNINSRVKRSYTNIASEFRKKQAEQVQSQIRVTSHQSNIQIIKLSPNGFRFATAGTRGTVIRLHSSLNGQLLASYSMGLYQSNMLGIDFLPTGSGIVCLNESNQVNFYHTKMSQAQIWSQKVKKKGEQIYQQSNPGSPFWFLSFAFQNLGYERPFCYCHLSQAEMQSQKEQSGKKKELIEQVEMQVITQTKQQHHASQIPAQQSPEEVKIAEVNSFSSNSQVVNPSQQVKPSNSFLEIGMDQIMRFQKSTSLLYRKSKQSKHENRLTNSQLAPKRNNSLRSISALSKRPSGNTVILEQEKAKFYGHTSVHFDSLTKVLILKNGVISTLKLDIFNGGEMVEQDRINILSDALFKDLL